MRSHAPLSRRRPPSTDCSASMDCGGTRAASYWGSRTIELTACAMCRFFYRLLRLASTDDRRDEFNVSKKRAVASPFFLTRKFRLTRSALLLRDDGNGDAHDDIGVQRDLQLMIADILERSLR